MRKLRYIGRYIIEDKTLGKGNFAVVELATHNITKTKVAIKVIDRHKIKEEYVRHNLGREARILSQLRHPNVVRLYETISSSSLYCLVTEYAGGGDLLTFVRSQRDGRLRESDARPFVRQLVSALHHLHERGVVHRDLKMENIMLDCRKKNIKIVDFGLSNCFSADQLLRTHCGSPEYAAPELFTAGNEYYGPEVDIWSLGINIYAMVCGRLPFTTPHSENRRQRLLQQLQYGLGPIQEKEMTLKLTSECRELLHQCIEPSPDLRAPLLDIEVQPWITDNGCLPFFPYQQPRKNRGMRQLIINKMSTLLNVSENKINANVHEYRLDEVSAIYNLLMEDHLSSKGYWNTDHTKMQVKRPNAVENDAKKDGGGLEVTTESSTATDEVRVSLRTPTIIGMVRPSQTEPCVDRRLLRSADFELSAVDNTDDQTSRRRPKTACFTQCSSKAKPMGNATTHNIMLARNKNFGSPVPAPHKLCGDCKTQRHEMAASRDDQQIVSIPKADHEEDIDIPASDHGENNSNQEPISITCDKQKPPKTLRFAAEPDGRSEMLDHIDRNEEFEEYNQEDNAGIARTIHYHRFPVTMVTTNNHEEDNKGIPRTVHYQRLNETMYSTTKPTVTLHSSKQLQHEMCDDGSFAVIDPSLLESRSPNEVNVIDMVQYFNSKHGYRVSETPFVFPRGKCIELGPGFRSKINQKEHIDPSNKESYHNGDINHVTPDSAQDSQAVTYKRCTPYSGPVLRKEDAAQSPTAIEIKLPRNDEGYQSDSESERGRSATPQKARWRPRFYQISRRGAGNVQTSPPRRAPQHHCDPSPSPSSRSPNIDRPMYCTPVASFQTTEDILDTRVLQVPDLESSTEEDTTTKNRMPQRLCWKKNGVPETSARKKSIEMKTKNSAKAKDLMQRDSVRQTYPQKAEMRIHSGRLHTKRDLQSSRSSSLSSSARTTRTMTSYSESRENGEPRHVACSTGTYKNAFRMEKYSGQCSPREEPDIDNVIDLSKQHLLTLLQQASATLENATKLAERKQCQSQLHYYHQTSHQRQPDKSWQKAMHQLKPHHHDTTGVARPKITDALDSENRPTVSRPSTVRTLGRSRRSGTSSARGGIEKQLGQRVTYEEGTINPKTGRPPTVPSSKQRKPPVFNMDSSRPVDQPVEMVNYRLPKMINDHTGTGEISKEWSIGYMLERKLSNTLKGGDVLTLMRKSPYAI